METSDQSGTAAAHLDVPTRLYISKEKVLEEAMHLLSLKIHDSRACAIGNDQVIGSICIDVPAHGEHPALKRKFFGDYKVTEADALESARLAALIYLQHACIILVDDVNHIELTEYKTKLTECHRKLQTTSSWVTLFQERAETLQKQLDAAHEENKKLVDAAKVSVVKKEELSPQSADLKTAVLPLPTVGVKQEMASPTPADNETGGSLSRRGKKRAFHESNARRVLFKE